jgi:hypothetical protein
MLKAKQKLLVPVGPPNVRFSALCSAPLLKAEQETLKTYSLNLRFLPCSAGHG